MFVLNLFRKMRKPCAYTIRFECCPQDQNWVIEAIL